MTRSEILQIAKPILFNIEMVQAILDGRKSTTRRVVKPQPRGVMYPKPLYMDEEFPRGWRDESRCDLFIPPCKLGDYLYVRETWAHPSEAEIAAGTDPGMFLYKADRVQPAATGKWNPSIHMPKEAARIFLMVTDVWPERLQEITMSEMLAEGVIPENVTGGQWQQWQNDYMKPVWDSTIKTKDLDKYGWDANPWVWVNKFERVGEEK